MTAPVSVSAVEAALATHGHVSWVTTSEPITVPCETCGGSGVLRCSLPRHHRGQCDVYPLVGDGIAECPNGCTHGRRPVRPGDQIELEAGEPPSGGWVTATHAAFLLPNGDNYLMPGRIPLPASGQTVGTVTVRTANVPIVDRDSDDDYPNDEWVIEVHDGRAALWTYTGYPICDHDERDISGQIVQPQSGRYATEIETAG